MKKFFTFILAVTILCCSIIPSVSAETNALDSTYETSSYTEYFEDGSYTVTTIKQSPTGRASTYTIIGNKHVDLYNSKDEIQWAYTLIGTFVVNQGVSAVCTESTYSSVVYEKSWSLTAHDNSYSNNIARGTATYKKKVLFITTNTHDIEAAIGCDVNGNVG